MKSVLALATIAATLAGCAYYNTPPVAVAPAAVVNPPNTVVLGAPAATAPSTTVVVPNR